MQENDDELGIISVFHQLLARKWFIFNFVLIFSLFGFLLSHVAPNEYTASSVVQIEKRSSNIALPAELVGELLDGIEQPSELETEFHVIKSRLTLGEVVRALRLNVTVTPVGPGLLQDVYYRYSALLSDNQFGTFVLGYFPERYARAGELIEVSAFQSFQPNTESSVTVTTMGDGKYSAELIHPSSPQREVKSGFLGEELVFDGRVSMVLEAIPTRSGVEFEISYVPERAAAKTLANSLQISERGRRSGTGIVDFHVTANKPKRAISVVNAVVSEYQRQSLSRRSAEVDQSIDFINEQLPIADESLKIALRDFNDYIDRSGAYASLSATTQEVVARIIELEAKLDEISFQKTQLATQVTENHPDFQRLVSEEAELRQRLIVLRDELDSVPETEQELAQLTKNVQSARELKEQLLVRRDQLRILKASAVGTIRILEKAEDAFLSGPNRTKPIAISAMLAIFLSCGYILLRNSLKVGIEDERDIEDLGLSVFATIPMVDGLRKSDATDQNYALAVAEPENLAIESLRALRTGLHFSLSVKSSKAIAITSPAPNEGKSFISLNLSIVAAQAGSRVLLIDTDLRRGELHKCFRIPRGSPGLVDFLANGGELSKIIHHSSNFGVDFIPTGGYPPNPSELLSSRKFNEILQSLDHQYDLIIFDCAPILAVTDPVIVAGYGIPSFLVVSHLRTNKQEIEASVKALKSIEADFSGVIINSFDQEKSRYGAYATKYGYYRASYRYSYEKKR